MSLFHQTFTLLLLATQGTPDIQISTIMELFCIFETTQAKEKSAFAISMVADSFYDPNSSEEKLSSTACNPRRPPKDNPTCTRRSGTPPYPFPHALQSPQSTQSNCVHFFPANSSIFGIKYSPPSGDSYRLSHWIHYELNLTDLTESFGLDSIKDIQGLIVQVDTDEYSGGFGQFVDPCDNLGEDCEQILNKSLNGGYTRPMSSMFMPCLYHQSVDPLPSNVFAYSYFAEKKKLANGLPPILHLFWKFSHSVCNHPEKLIIRTAVAITDEAATEPHICEDFGREEEHLKHAYLTAWVLPTWSIELQGSFKKDGATFLLGGPAPSLFPDLLNTPNSEIDFYDNLLDQRYYPWINKTGVTDVNSTFLDNDEKPTTIRPPECRPLQGKQLKEVPQQSCNQRLSQPARTPRCRSPDDGTDPRKFVEKLKDKFNNKGQVVPLERKYKGYYEYIEARYRFHCFCQLPQKVQSNWGKEPDIQSLDKYEALLPIPPDDHIIQDIGGPKVEKKVLRTDMDSLTFPGTDVYKFRVLHGITGIIAAFFVTPISIFISRHYKETYMRERILYNKPWLVMHMLAIFVTFQLFLYGWISIKLGQRIYGSSIVVKSIMANQTKLRNPLEIIELKLQENDLVINVHRFGGYGSMGMFLLLTILGGLRPVGSAARLICIHLHWIFGNLFYVSLHLVIASSVFIKASPSILQKNLKGVPLLSRIDDDHNRKKYMIIYISGLWVCMDFCIHLIMDIIRFWIDRVVRIKRRFSFVPIPVLNDQNGTDLTGSMYRRLLLYMYVGLCGFVSLLNTTILTYPLNENFSGFGPMTCTHSCNSTTGSCTLDFQTFTNCDATNPTTQLPKELRKWAKAFKDELGKLKIGWELPKMEVDLF